MRRGTRKHHDIATGVFKDLVQGFPSLRILTDIVTVLLPVPANGRQLEVCNWADYELHVHVFPEEYMGSDQAPTVLYNALQDQISSAGSRD